MSIAFYENTLIKVLPKTFDIYILYSVLQKLITLFIILYCINLVCCNLTALVYGAYNKYIIMCIISKDMEENQDEISSDMNPKRDQHGKINTVLYRKVRY